jgi:hypothetical protein
MARDYLYGEVANFRCDIHALREFYEKEIRRQPSKPYFDNGANYVGWAITSRDGSIHDGIQHIPVSSGGPLAETAVQPTPLCKGPVEEALARLYAAGLRPFRVRVMALANHGFDMKFHCDAKREGWRVHVPIVTNPGAFFEWRIGEETVRRHFPADGRAWFVRVDKMHRAVNEGEGTGIRAHLLMSLRGVPAPSRFGADSELLPGLTRWARWARRLPV